LILRLLGPDCKKYYGIKSYCGMWDIRKMNFQQKITGNSSSWTGPIFAALGGISLLLKRTPFQLSTPFKEFLKGSHSFLGEL
jgi:hypothetical protein